MAQGFCVRVSRSLATLLLLAAAAAVARPGYAGVITFTAPTINLAESNSVQTGYFNVLVSETGGSDLLNAFQVNLLLSSQSNVTFINTDLNTNVAAVNAAPYVYAGNEGGGGYPYVGSNQAFNYDYPLDNDVALSSTPLGLMRVEYSIAAGWAGSVALTFNQDNPHTDGFADLYQKGTDVSDVYSPSSVNGAIIVAPEPSTLVLFGLSGIGLWAFSRRRLA